MKPKAMPLANAAEKLRVTRPMPVVAMLGPLPSEDAPAVAVAKAPARKLPPKRPYRVTTYLSEEAGARLTRLVAHFKASHGRRCGAPDVLERALLVLERELNLSG